MNRTDITLGLNFIGHDISYTLLDSYGIPIIIAEEERYSRIKKGTFIPNPQTIFSVIQEAGLRPEDIRFLAIANINEFIENRSRHTLDKYIPYGNARISDVLFRSIINRLPNVISINELRHHLCHAASAFFPSPYMNAAVVTVDGMGEDETVNIWHGKINDLTKVFSIPHPHSIGYLFQAIANWMGLSGGEKEGKLMGLASYGKPIFKDIFYKNFIAIDTVHGFYLNPNLEKIPCTNEEWVNYCELFFGERNISATMNELHKDIAASLQDVLEEVLINILKIAKGLTHESFCCMAGGVFMNSMANGRLRREKIFKDIWVQPLASDNGLSLGAALWSYYYGRNERKRWKMVHPFWGTEITERGILDFIHVNEISCYKSENIELETAQLLADGKIVGWIQGKSEVGARALGHRSIFADPRQVESKNKINSLIKQREDWRPFAPLVLEEEMNNFFDDSLSSPFMMFVSNAIPDCPLPAALHVDNTGRVQTINKDFDNRVYNLICEFRKITGIGALLNTSFNLRGEPIVRTIEQAYDDFTKSGMDVLIVNDFIFKKSYDFTGTTIPPPIAQIPSIAFSDNLQHQVKIQAKSVALVTLGNPHLLKETLDFMRSNNPHTEISVYQPSLCRNQSPFELIFLKNLYSDEILSVDNALENCHVLLLIPIWIEIAFELIPHILNPFIKSELNNHSTTVTLIDASGNTKYLSSILPRQEWIINNTVLSEIERFWFTTSTYYRTGSGN